MVEEDDATRSQAAAGSEGSSRERSDGIFSRLVRKLRGASASPRYLGRYRVLEKLGEGGMGVVYAAEDASLGRRVAVKTIHERDDASRKRFQREARAAAVVNHPNVCQVYEIGEHSGELFIAMELLTGESLAERLMRGPMTVSEVLRLGREMLAALDALHESGMVHRDLKPSNVFLTPHGVKLLDFGLARPLTAELTRPPESPLTELTDSGLIVGTPRYMAPEQLVGKPVDARTDLFSVGVILYEAVSGRRPFHGATAVEAMSATLHENPPALAGGRSVVRLDHVLRHALAKDPDDRPRTAEAMSRELESVGAEEASRSQAPREERSGPVARALTRLAVLPFRLLRPDPDTDFLRYALADALSGSLSQLPFVVLRSTAAAAKFDGEAPDLEALAQALDIDVAVFGRILRAGDNLRVRTEAVTVPAGTVIASQTTMFSLDDIFDLQDELASRIVASLSASLGSPEPSRSRRAPASARAYEFYLRATETVRNWAQAAVARDLLRQCLEEDGDFAPAWAQLGRSYRLIAKYHLERPSENLALAEEAFQRAIELDPTLPVAHKLYADHEAEVGRAGDAMKRLLDLANDPRNRNDPELFAGLVHATRYCGLMEASAAAHREARRLDPNAATGANFGLWALGHFQTILDDRIEPNDFLYLMSLEAMERKDEARAAIREGRKKEVSPVVALILEGLDALVERRPDAPEALARVVAAHRDPEALFFYALCQVRAGDLDAALATLSKSVVSGYTIPEALRTHPWLEPLRGNDTLRSLIAEAERARGEHFATYRAERGDSLLGVGPSADARAVS